MNLEFKQKIRVTASFVPVALIFFTFLSAFIDMNFVLCGNLIGCSVLTNISFICYYTLNKKYCFITRFSPIGLILVNLIDIIGCFVDYEIYKFIFTFVISSLTISLGLYFDLNKRMNK